MKVLVLTHPGTNSRGLLFDIAARFYNSRDVPEFLGYTNEDA